MEYRNGENNMLNWKRKLMAKMNQKTTKKWIDREIVVEDLGGI